MTTFNDLGLCPALLRAVDDAGYTAPTPIQEQAIPYILQMRDILGCAQTGTGKTAGFTLPMIEILAGGRAKARMPRSLILEPTRELATQVAESFQTYGKYHPQLTEALLIGGENMGPQIKLLDRGVDVLIATPGRMIDLFERGQILLSDIKIFVIDEADRMLDMGFIPDIEKIAALLPPLRQTLLFSATMPPEIRKLADRFLSNPKNVSVAPSATTADNIRQVVIALPSDNDWQKREALRLLLRRENVQNAFIFCNRKRDVAMLQKSLKRHGFNVGALHGDMDQSSRTATLDSFRSGEITFLACSDVAARGLDVPDVSHVFNFDVPFHSEDYVHRIGRTGRAGKSGTAYTFLTPESEKHIGPIEELIKLKLPREILADLPEPSRLWRREGTRHAEKGRDRRPPRSIKHAAPKKEKYKHEGAKAAPYGHEKAASRKALPAKASAASHRPAESKHAGKYPHIQTRAFGDNLPAFLRRPPARGKKSA